jgi:hypothetical protein
MKTELCHERLRPGPAREKSLERFDVGTMRHFFEIASSFFGGGGVSSRAGAAAPAPAGWLRTIAAGLLVSICAHGAESGDSLFARSTMKEVDLNGLKVWLGKPVQVTAQIGWGMNWVHPGWQPSWSFIHLTPYLARFPHGNLIATYAMDPDTQQNPFFLSGFQISRDGGAHWERRYAVLIQHIPMVYLPKGKDSLMAIPSELMYRSEGDTRNFVGPCYLFEEGGAKMVLVPDGVRLVDWPWPTRVDPSAGIDAGGPQPRDNWHVGVSITGSVIKIGEKWIASIYGRKGEAPCDSSMLIASEDGGTTWRYFSTIADGDPSHVGEDRFEGANETSFVQLADGDLMAVFRTGSGTVWHVRRSYSHDGGRTWTKSDALPAWSVEPQVIRTANGTIALATGRPGIYLWLATDPRATTWQKVDLVAYHNQVVEDPSARITSFPRPASARRRSGEAWQTTSYTAMVETAPNRILLIYDRDAERQPVDEKDISRVFVLPIEIERD